MKANNFLTTFLSLVVIVGVLYFLGVSIPGLPAMKRKEDEDTDADPSAEVLPEFDPTTFGYNPTRETTGVTADGLAVTTETQPALFTDSGTGKLMIERRARELWNLERKRSEIRRGANLNTALTAGLSQPEDMAAYLIEMFGSLNAVPVVPAIVDGGEFIDTMQAITQLTDFEEMARAGRDRATSTYDRVAVSSDTDFYDPEIIGLQAHVGTWGDLPRRRRDAEDGQIKRWDRFADDFQLFAANAIDAALTINNSLESRAIMDVMSSGVKFVGYAS